MLEFYLAMIDTDEGKCRFEELYREYRQDMYKTAYNILRNSYDAEDAVHNAFMIILNNPKKISEIKCPQTHTYLIIIVKGLALKIYNAKKKTPMQDIEDAEGADDTDIEDEVVSKIKVERLKGLLKQLPENYYDILFLEQSMGLSIAEISESLGITYQNAKKRLQRAKHKLNKMMIEESMKDAI